MTDEPDRNILLLANRLEVRGTSVYTIRLADHLTRHGYDPFIVCPDAQVLDGPRRAHLNVREYSRLNYPLVGRVVLEWIVRDLEANPPALIHIQSRTMHSHGKWLARHLERPYVLTVHDYLGQRERLRFDREWGRRVIAVSQSVRAELVARSQLTDADITVIHPGVDEQAVEQLPPVLAPGRVPVIGTAGPLESIKGLPFFLGAAQRVLAAGHDVQFLVSGGGPEESNLRRLARELGIHHKVTFVPNLPDFSGPLKAMDIFCLPSLRQGLGTIMLEAMAHGRPVIATGVGGVYSVIRDNETGLVIPPSDSARLAERMLELLNDPVRARSIGEAGRQLVRDEFGAEKMIRKTVEVYRAVLAPPCSEEPEAAIVQSR